EEFVGPPATGFGVLLRRRLPNRRQAATVVGELPRRALLVRCGLQAELDGEALEGVGEAGQREIGAEGFVARPAQRARGVPGIVPVQREVRDGSEARRRRGLGCGFATRATGSLGGTKDPQEGGERGGEVTQTHVSNSTRQGTLLP